jgi:hypothetical protein
MARERRERGQGLVEFALVLPILVVLIVSVGELGLIFGKMHSLGYASREGARAGAALAQGEGCSVSNPDLDPSKVDATLIGAVQRILASPDSGINPSKIQQIRIFKATDTGSETSGTVSTWIHVGPNGGPEIDPGPGVVRIDFDRTGAAAWPACSRHNGEKVGGVQLATDSIGVTVKYTYDFVTPLPALLNAISGGALSLTLSETTIMALNPTA